MSEHSDERSTHRVKVRALIAVEVLESIARGDGPWSDAARPLGVKNEATAVLIGYERTRRVLGRLMRMHAVDFDSVADKMVLGSQKG